jgi:hypothetical protein
MIHIDETTDKLVKLIAEFPGDMPYQRLLNMSSSRLNNVDAYELERQLAILSNLNIAKTQNGIILKLPNFADVLHSGSVGKYLDNQKNKSIKDNEFKDLQYQEMKIKIQYIEKQYKDQRLYWYLALIISFLALVIALLSYLKK